MTAIETLARLLEHAAWANRGTLAALERAGTPDAARALLGHVALHGAHHRGRIAAELRRASLEPPYVDFVHAARSGRI